MLLRSKITPSKNFGYFKIAPRLFQQVEYTYMTNSHTTTLYLHIEFPDNPTMYCWRHWKSVARVHESVNTDEHSGVATTSVDFTTHMLDSIHIDVHNMH